MNLRVEGGAPRRPLIQGLAGVRLASPIENGGRKTPAHFPTVESGFRAIIIFLTVCTHRRRRLLANKEEAVQCIIGAWQAADFWRVGPLRDHARSHPFALRAKYFSAATTEELDRVLEKSRHASIA